MPMQQDVHTPRRARYTGPTPDVEQWIARRLGISDLFEGLTDYATRSARIRDGILALGIADERVVQHRDETWRALFERVYRTPLEAPAQ